VVYSTKILRMILRVEIGWNIQVVIFVGATILS